MAPSASTSLSGDQVVRSEPEARHQRSIAAAQEKAGHADSAFIADFIHVVVGAFCPAFDWLAVAVTESEFRTSTLLDSRAHKCCILGNRDAQLQVVPMHFREAHLNELGLLSRRAQQWVYQAHVCLACVGSRAREPDDNVIPVPWEPVFRQRIGP